MDVTLELREKAIFSKNLSPGNIYYCFDYIPGSVLWGMFATRFPKDAMELFYQTGVIGGTLFVLSQLSFIIYVWRGVRRLPRQWAMPTLALFFTYFSMLSLGSFQPFLTVPSVAVLFYFILGITARYVYWGRRSKTAEG